MDARPHPSSSSRERFPFPFRTQSEGRGTGIGNGPQVADAPEGVEVDEAREHLPESLVADAETSAEVGASKWSVRECREDRLVEGISRGVVLREWCVGEGGGEQLEVRMGLCAEGQAEGFWRGRGAMLGSEQELAAMAAEQEEGIGPREEVAGAAEALPGLPDRAVLAGVMDDEDGSVMGALQLAEVAKERGDLSGVVLVDAVQPDEGVEDEEPRRVLLHGVAEAPLVVGAVESEGGSGDEVHVERAEVEAAMTTDAFEARLDDEGGVLGHVEESTSGVADGEGAETGLAARDGERHLEGEPRLAALRRAADDADGCPGPKRGDEPGGSRLELFDVGGSKDG